MGRTNAYLSPFWLKAFGFVTRPSTPFVALNSQGELLTEPPPHACFATLFCSAMHVVVEVDELKMHSHLTPTNPIGWANSRLHGFGRILIYANAGFEWWDDPIGHLSPFWLKAIGFVTRPPTPVQLYSLNSQGELPTEGPPCMVSALFQPNFACV